MEFHPNNLSDLDELTEEHLGFSALSDGLGFSKRKDKEKPAEVRSISREEIEELDPLPPAPMASAAVQNAFSGLGAVAAGPARPAPSIFHKPAPTRIAPAPAAAAQVLAEPAAPRTLRIAAFLLDGLLVLVPLATAWFLSFASDAQEMFLQDPRAPLGLFGLIFSVYFLLSESFGGQSLAKMMLDLHVVEDDKYQKPTGFRHAVARLGLFVLGFACLGLGFFASFWDSKRRPWHDRYSGTIVRRKA